MNKVIKRDGTIVEFDKKKIANAIKKAMAAINVEDERVPRRIANEISKIEDEMMSVEEIQDIVEDKLMASSLKDVAREYVTYRYAHNLARDEINKINQTVLEKLSASNVENQNANVDEYSFGGRKGEADEVILKKIALDNMSKLSRMNHLNNYIYIHDLGSYYVGMHNCLSIPFDDLLEKGFVTRQTDIRPANSIGTAFQLLAVIFQLQSLQQFGGVSATHLDWTMVPYVRKSFAKHFKNGIKYCCPNSRYDLDTLPKELSFDDAEANEPYNKPAYQYAMDMTEKEIHQAVEGMYHNLNTLQSRSGNQLKRMAG